MYGLVYARVRLWASEVASKVVGNWGNKVGLDAPMTEAPADALALLAAQSSSTLFGKSTYALSTICPVRPCKKFHLRRHNGYQSEQGQSFTLLVGCSWVERLYVLGRS